ncbi:hypothetical protein D3C75_595390 [compost metagenome]
MPGIVKNILRGPFLNMAPLVHNADTVTHMPDNTEIVADEQIRQIQLLLYIPQEVQHLRLNRYVKCRDRLIGNNQLGLQGNRPGYSDTLALAAGEFMRIFKNIVRTKSDLLQQLLHLPHFLLRGQLLEIAQRLGDNIQYAFLWIE